MSISKFAMRLEKLGFTTSINKDSIDIDIDINSKGIKITFDDEWLKSIKEFYKARQYQFDLSRRLLSGNKFVEFQIISLSPGFFYRIQYRFSDAKENQVVLSRASKEFLLSFFESQQYEDMSDLVHRRIQRRLDRSPAHVRSRRRLPMSVETLFLIYYTATYTPKNKMSRDKQSEVGLKKIKSCLFSLAYNKHESLEVLDEIKSTGFSYHRISDEDLELEIPTANYDSNLVCYYKVAKSSSFPGQVFLSYYHILEYFFLIVANENLFQIARSQLNNPSFKTTDNNISKLLATIKRYDSTNDEQEMLRAVLRKYIPEEEFIAFVKKLESDSNEKLFSGSKQEIFGELFTIKLEQGHALSNSASVLKHIRNYLVHSSNKYTGEECYLPFSESEDIVVKYIPILQFMAEKVIFSTAS